MNNLEILCFDEEATKYPLAQIADAAYKKLGQTAPLEIEVAFVTEDEIRTLNRENRDVDRVTDVLSFPNFDGIRYKTLTLNDYPSEIDEESGRLPLGSICVCESRAAEQAEEYGHSLLREVCYLTLHGILHCFGYDHMNEKDEKEMTELAEEIMTAAGVGRNA